MVLGRYSSHLTSQLDTSVCDETLEASLLILLASSGPRSDLLAKNYKKLANARLNEFERKGKIESCQESRKGHWLPNMEMWT